MKRDKMFIYQILPRLLGNKNHNKKNGSIEDNGSGKFNDISTTLLEELKESGYTHIWLIGVLAHASVTDYTSFGIPEEYPEIIKGIAGSPYAVRDYYDVDPNLAVDVNDRMGEYEAAISRIHDCGMKVIMDFIPNHLARNYKSQNLPNGLEDFATNDDTSCNFLPSNNFYYLSGKDLDLTTIDSNNHPKKYKESPAKATGNDSFTNKPSIYDWYETVKLNYGVDYLGGGTKYFNPIPDTWIKMRDILLFWASKRVDGFRCDMAEMVPIEFWQWVVPQIKEKHSHIIFIAEIYNPSLYRSFLGDNIFDYLYDKVGLYDVIKDVSCGNRPSSDISSTLNSVGDIQHKMLNFLENHDEQRIASDYFLGDGAKAKASMIVTACVNRNPVMVYFGQEIGEPGMDEEGFSGKDGRTSIFDYWSVDTIARWNNDGNWNDELLTHEEKNLKQFYSRLITLCNIEKSLSQGLFYDLMPANYDNHMFDSSKQYAFLRGYEDEVVLIVANFDNKPVSVDIQIPRHAYEFFNISNKKIYIGVSILDNSYEKIFFSMGDTIRVSVCQNSGTIHKVLSL